MPSRPDLARTQGIFWDLISAPEGVGAGIRAMQADGRLGATDLSSVVRGDEKLGSIERLDIYADMYFYRLRDSLAEDFPKVAAILGGARFHNLVTDYLLEHPSTFWSLRDLGLALPGFLEKHGAARWRPFLADMARLERARLEVFDEEDAVPIRRDRIQRLQAGGLDSARLGLIPACRLLELDWAVAPAWRRIEESGADHPFGEANSAAIEGTDPQTGSEPVAIEHPARKRSRMRVWRQRFSVFHRTIEADEHACLVEASRRGVTLPRLCEVVLEHLGPEADLPDAAARRMTDLVQTWIEDEVIREDP